MSQMYGKRTIGLMYILLIRILIYVYAYIVHIIIYRYARMKFLCLST